MELKITPLNNRVKKGLHYAAAIAVCVVLFLLIAINLHRWANPKPPPAPPVVEVTPEPAPPKTDPILAFILEREGGYNPNDPSFEGVYQPTYDWFREVKGLHDAPRNVRDLQDRMDIVHDFYAWYLYELNSGIAVVPDWFQLMLADFWTTSMSASIKPLQEWADVRIDGVWGHETERAVLAKFQTLEDPPKLARWYTSERKDYYRRLGYHESHSLLGRADIVEAETLKKLHGTDVMVHRVQTIREDDMRLHAPLESLSLEDRLARLEKLLEKR